MSNATNLAGSTFTALLLLGAYAVPALAGSQGKCVEYRGGDGGTRGYFRNECRDTRIVAGFCIENNASECSCASSRICTTPTLPYGDIKQIYQLVRTPGTVNYWACDAGDRIELKSNGNFVCR